VTRHDLGQWVFSRWAFGAACCALAAITAAAQSAPQTPATPADRGRATAAARATTDRDATELVEFRKRVEAFVDLRRKLEATLPGLPKEATPEQIDRNQRAFATLVVASRPKARQGDLVTPPAQAYIRDVLKRLFAATNAAGLRAAIDDDNPGPVKVTINGRYPDQVPLATMPPAVLETLPKLPEEIEYRFVGDALILLDQQAHLVIDIVPAALPK
jgi:hypothetical protein